MYALIQKSDNNILRVAKEGVTLSEEKPFYWVECPDACNTTWTFDGTTFTEPVLPEPTPEQLQEQINNDARAFLESTDWYVVRFAETGVVIPQDISAARQAARERIV